MEEIEDLERDYLKDIVQIEAETNARLEAEWREWEEYESRLPAKLEIKKESVEEKKEPLKID
jgi:hypothetical protein